MPVLGAEMGERWWTNVDFWNGICEVAVLYGYHPTFAHDINVISTSFPRGWCRYWESLREGPNWTDFINKSDSRSIHRLQRSGIIISALIRLRNGQEQCKKRITSRFNRGGVCGVMTSTFDLLEYFYFNFNFLDPGTFALLCVAWRGIVWREFRWGSVLKSILWSRVVGRIATIKTAYRWW